MHDTSFEKMERFVEVYLAAHRQQPLRILDVGSQLVEADQRTYRSIFDAPAWRYDGLDVEPGHNVDIAVADSYHWSEVADDTYDLVVSGQAFEHIEFFWATAFEIGRVMRPGAVTALIAPSNGFEHRYPVDCWRFYADGCRAIAAYLEFEVVDVFTDWGRDVWQDSILVMRKPVSGVDERARFARRAELQRALLDRPPREAAAEVAVPDASVLATLQPGLLSPVLEATRVAWLERSAPPETPVAELGDAPPAVRTGWRATVAALLGERGMRAYRRVRYGSGTPG
jgi:SAM-dependent methyltransferase